MAERREQHGGIRPGQVETVNANSNDHVNAIQFTADGYIVDLNGGFLSLDKPSGSPTPSISVGSGMQATITDLRGTNGLNYSGPGTLTLSLGQNLSGVTTIASGKLVLGSSQSLQNSTVVLNVANGLQLSSTATLGGLAGTGAFSAGTLTVGGDNDSTTYTGGLTATTLNKTGTGTFLLNGGAANNISTLNAQMGNVTVGAGTLSLVQPTTGQAALGVGAPTVPGFLPSLSPGTLTINNGAVVNTLTNTGFAYVDGSGGSNITVDGAGSALNTKIFYAGTQYSGGLVVQNGGLLSATGYAVVGDQGSGLATVRSGGVFQLTGSGSVTLGASGGTGAFTVDGAGSQLSAGSGTVVVGNGSLTAQNGGLVQSSNAIVGGKYGFTGTATVTGSGSQWTTGNLGLGGDAAGAGTALGTGALTISNGGAVQVTGKTGFYSAGSSLTVNGGSLTTATLVSSGGNGSIVLAANPTTGQALTVTGGSAANYSGTISGNGGITLSGGQQTLSGTISGAVGLTVSGGQQTISGANSFTGATTINGGTLTLGNSLALQNSAVAVNVAGGLQVNGLASVSVGGISGSASSINLGGAALVINGAANSSSVYNGQLLGVGGLTMNSGAQTLGSAFAISGGAVTLNGGVLTLGDPTALANASSVTINGANALNLSGLGYVSLNNLSGSGALNLGATYLVTAESQSATYSGAISGAGGIQTLGGGKLTLTGANTYTGLTEGANVAQMGGTNYSSIAADGRGNEVFTIGGGAYVSPGNGFGTFTAQYGGTIYYGSATIEGGFISGNGHHIAGDPAGVATFNGTTINADATLNFTGQTKLNNVTNNGKLVLSDPTVSVNWNYGRNGASGEVDVNSSFSVVDLQSAGLLKIGDGGTLYVSQLNNPQQLPENLVLSAGSRTYVGSADTPGGTISLANSNRIELGGLLVNNGTINGGVDVNYGGFLEGAGTITGTVNVGMGGTVHAGNSPGTLTTGGATWGAGAIYEFDIADATGTAGNAWSFWDMTGGLDITAGGTANSRFTIDITSLLGDGTAGQAANFDPNLHYAWLLASATNINGFSASDFTLTTTNFQNTFGSNGGFQILQQGNDVYLLYAPEPGTLGMMVLAMGVVAGMARRKQRG